MLICKCRSGDFFRESGNAIGWPYDYVRGMGGGRRGGGREGGREGKASTDVFREIANRTSEFLGKSPDLHLHINVSAPVVRLSHSQGFRTSSCGIASAQETWRMLRMCSDKQDVSFACVAARARSKALGVS